MTASYRKIAAILAADITGYSRLMGEDEARTLAALRELRQDLLLPTVSGCNGEVVKSMGDGWLIEFGSVIDAVNCDIQTQQGLAGQDIIRLRIGIHIGDIVHEDEDICGDGVNIAARLQEICETGGIALSGQARGFFDGRLSEMFQDDGARQLKNIADAVRVFMLGGSPSRPHRQEDASEVPPDKPSIAVLPFDNMSHDPEQEYFADGIAEDIITDLSKVSGLLVIARNSSFIYKGKSSDIRQVCRELGGALRPGG